MIDGSLRRAALREHLLIAVPDFCFDKICLDPSVRHGHGCRRSLAARGGVGRTELAGFVPRRCVVTDSRLEQGTWVRTDVRLGTDRVSGYLCHQLYIQVFKKFQKAIRKKKNTAHTLRSSGKLLVQRANERTAHLTNGGRPGGQIQRVGEASRRLIRW